MQLGVNPTVVSQSLSCANREASKRERRLVVAPGDRLSAPSGSPAASARGSAEISECI
jgi:hypothetical protein